MLNIAVCDDEVTVVEKITNMINEYASKNDISCSIKKFYDGEEIIKSNTKFDLIFLDIEMKSLNGIETAIKIRDFDMNVPIVYVTGYTQYWRKAYKVHAFEFIVKPFDYSDVSGVLHDFLLSHRDTNPRIISFETKDGMIAQNVNEICYFIIKEKRMIQMSTVYGDYIVRENLSYILEKLNSDEFYMTHKSCIVNLKYVQTINKNDGIIMKDGAWLPLSVRKQKDFYYKLSKQLRE